SSLSLAHSILALNPFPPRRSSDLGKFKVIAVCDLNPERMNALGDEFGIERRTSQFDELLAMDDVDIVDICTPPMVHYEQVLAAQDRKSTRLNSSHVKISYAVFCLK